MSGRPKNASGTAKSETLTMRVTTSLKKRITTLHGISDHRNGTLLSFIGVLIEIGIERHIDEEIRRGHLTADKAKKLS